MTDGIDNGGDSVSFALAAGAVKRRKRKHDRLAARACTLATDSDDSDAPDGAAPPRKATRVDVLVATPAMNPVSSTASIAVAKTGPHAPRRPATSQVARLLEQRRIAEVDAADVGDADSFRRDVARCAPDGGTAAYARVPVSRFGAALLKGMGWDGSSDGKEAPEAGRIVPRSHLLGLGASPNMREDRKTMNHASAPPKRPRLVGNDNKLPDVVSGSVVRHSANVGPSSTDAVPSSSSPQRRPAALGSKVINLREAPSDDRDARSHRKTTGLVRATAQTSGGRRDDRDGRSDYLLPSDSRRDGQSRDVTRHGDRDCDHARRRDSKRERVRDIRGNHDLARKGKDRNR
jgi:G-patch domain